MPYPCMRPQLKVLRIMTSSVPCRSSVFILPLLSDYLGDNLQRCSLDSQGEGKVWFARASECASRAADGGATCCVLSSVRPLHPRIARVCDACCAARRH